MEGVERAAIFLLGLGEQNAAAVLKYLEPKQIQKVGVVMTSIANVSRHDFDNVVNDFIQESENSLSLGVDPENYVKQMLISAVGEEHASTFLDRIKDREDQKGLNNLKWLDARTIADLIRTEHPQTIATILTYLDSDQAAEVITLFAIEKRVDLLMRMSTMESVKPEALQELGEIIEEQLAGRSRGKSSSIGGIKSVADIINYLKTDVEAEVLEGLKRADEKLYSEIQDKMFVFENLADLDDRSMQTLLRQVPNEHLLISLKGADEVVREKIFKNMSQRAADLLKDDLDAQGPVKVSEVELAQKEILTIARKLAESGEITLGSKGGEEMI